MSEPKVVIAEQDGVDSMEEQVNALLNILGHPEALVTDLSDFGDFIMGPFHEIEGPMQPRRSRYRCGTHDERQAEFDALLAEAGITTKIDVFDTFIVGIRKILADNPNWPKPATLN